MIRLNTLALTTAILIGGTSLAHAQTTSSPGGTTSAGTATGSAPTGSAMTPGMSSSSTDLGTGRSDVGTGIGNPSVGTGASEGSVYGANPIPNSSVTRNSAVGTDTGSYLPTPGAGDRITVPDTGVSGSASGTSNLPDVTPANPVAGDDATPAIGSTNRQDCPPDTAGVPNCAGGTP